MQPPATIILHKQEPNNNRNTHKHLSHRFQSSIFNKPKIESIEDFFLFLTPNGKSHKQSAIVPSSVQKIFFSFFFLLQSWFFICLIDFECRNGRLFRKYYPFSFFSVGGLLSYRSPCIFGKFRRKSNYTGFVILIAFDHSNNYTVAPVCAEIYRRCCISTRERPCCHPPGLSFLNFICLFVPLYKNVHFESSVNSVLLIIHYVNESCTSREKIRLWLFVCWIFCFHFEADIERTT